MKTEEHISLVHLHFLSPKHNSLLFFSQPVWKLRLYFISPVWPAILFVFLFFGLVRRKTHFSFVNPTRPDGKFISLLPARPTGKVISHLTARIFQKNEHGQRKIFFWMLKVLNVLLSSEEGKKYYRSLCQHAISSLFTK